MFSQQVIQVLKEQIWYLATCNNDQPNVIPVAFKEVTQDGNLAVGDVFLHTTLENIAANPRISVAASNASSLEGYQIQGQAHYYAQGEIVEKFKQQVETMFQSKMTAKGALVIVPERVIVTTPGADNKKVIWESTACSD